MCITRRRPSKLGVPQQQLSICCQLFIGIHAINWHGNAIWELTKIRSALEWYVLALQALRKWGRPSSGHTGLPQECCAGVAAQTTKAEIVWVVNFYSTTKTKQYTIINPVTIMTMSQLAESPGWQSHCDDESIHRYSVRIIDQSDVIRASGSHIDDITIAKLLTFEIISVATRNEGAMISVCLGPCEDSITNEQWYFAIVNITRGWIHVHDDRFQVLQ